MICLTILFLAVSLLLHLLARHVPGFADAFAACVNPFMVGTEGRLAGLFPFSLGEALLILLLLLAMSLSVRAAVCLIRAGKEKREPRAGGGKIRRRLRGLCLFLSVLLLLFVLNEDVYFSRTGLAVSGGLESRAYSNEELTEVCLYLAEEINACAGLVERDERGIMVLSGDPSDLVIASLQELGEEFPCLQGYYPRPKPVLCSFVLSYMSFTGIYSILTCEANYNRDMPAYNIPFTMGHELSHLKGIMSEKEANFAGFLSCIRSEDPDLHYSGAMLGFIYCGNELAKRDPEALALVRDRIDERALLDLSFNSRFWDSYEGKVSETADRVNDAYLKSGGISEGVASYDLVVDMIVTYMKKKY